MADFCKHVYTCVDGREKERMPFHKDPRLFDVALVLAVLCDFKTGLDP